MKQAICTPSIRPLYIGFIFYTILLSIFFTVFLIFPYHEGQCGQVTLTWDPNSEPDLAGYEIYYGTASGNYQWNLDVGNVTTYTLTGLETGATYYAAATAYNTQGLESAYSNEVFYTVPACNFTLSPSSASFSASGGSGSVLVTTQAGCNWGTSAAASWVTVNSGSGIGNGSMSYSVSSNSGTTRIASITVAGNVFTITQSGQSAYTITASAGTGGTIAPSGTVTVQSGGSQTFSISPATGYRIAAVTVDGVSQGAIASYTFSGVTANHTISATFSTITYYILSVSKTGTGSGTVTANPSGSSFTAGTVVNLTAAADSNSVFSGWSGGCTGTASTCQVTLNANVSVTAVFSSTSVVIPTVTTASATSVSSSDAQLNGSVNPNGSSTTYTFQWGRSRNFGNTTAVQSAGSGTVMVSVSAGLSSLRPNTTCYYRLVATNSAGTAYGATKILKASKK
jgi:hypothetical protein